MTKNELMNLAHLDVAEEKRLLHLHTEAGWVICNYTEDMEITNYCSTNCLYLPIADEYMETYSTITVEQDAIYTAELEAEMKLNEEIIED